jgi:hypothetical protein
MAITPPTLEKSVFNRIPFLIDDETNTVLIQDFAAEVMAELYRFMEIEEADMLDDTKYSVAQKSLIADLVSIQLLTRKVLFNGEGNGTSAGAGNKILKKGKAGETEAEFTALKASDGTRLLMEATSLISKFMSDALRKARSLGFILDIAKDGQFVVEAMSGPLPGPIAVNYDC